MRNLANILQCCICTNYNRSMNRMRQKNGFTMNADDEEDGAVNDDFWHSCSTFGINTRILIKQAVLRYYLFVSLLRPQTNVIPIIQGDFVILFGMTPQE